MITDKLLPLITEWRNRPLESVYPIVFLDAMHFKVRVDGKVTTKAFYSVLAFHRLKYVVSKDQKAFMADLKLVYRASSKDLAEHHLLELGEKWDKKYPVVIKSWNDNWENLSQYFKYTI